MAVFRGTCGLAGGRISQNGGNGVGYAPVIGRMAAKTPIKSHLANRLAGHSQYRISYVDSKLLQYNFRSRQKRSKP